MKQNYLPELNEMYQKSASKLQRHTSLPQQPKSYKLEKLKKFMKMLECAIAFLQVSKSNISLNYRDRYLAENVKRNEDERGTCRDRYQTNVNPSTDLYE
ncbi:mediator of RNA polymerase II transcription subunit 15a-like [Glycine max]|uniref:mediator of RNA polymerase II transcription subunit 15a-like n=1 Tax=Glycine max TaxID=3847 RepID=UPI001B357744|nr:mediator of RNA polymerase II transcription subunit 15a-like [Glycine max]